MNKCNLVRDLLPLYVDDALSEDSRAQISALAQELIK